MVWVYLCWSFITIAYIYVSKFHDSHSYMHGMNGLKLCFGYMLGKTWLMLGKDVTDLY